MNSSITLLIFFNIIYSTAAYKLHYIAREQRKSPKCEKVIATTCLNRVSQGYNSTMFPNHVGQVSQKEAIAELGHYDPLIEVGCSKYLSTFLCSVYVPVCTPGLGKPIKPCRRLCEHARDGCKPIIEKYGYRWRFNCTDFPDPTKDKNEVCLGISEERKTIEDNKNREKKRRKKKGRVSGVENDVLSMNCPKGKWIYIRKVLHSNDSTCCRTASKAVLTAMCNGKNRCLIKNAPAMLGGHCKEGRTGHITIRFKCTHFNKKSAACT